ncbi:MAG: zinc ribbon domain-containing protein [Chloroflexia bacterium]|nr:zinc ribbon domain-containing protein [Chloroflexia bacterium]
MPDDRSPAANTAGLLRRGIAAAKAGRQEEAQALLSQVVQQDERSLPAWLWLSAVVESLEERELCLENVLTLDPQHQAARRGLRQVRGRLQQQWIEAGLEAARAGQREEARTLLSRVVERDERNLEAWRALSVLVEGPQQRQVCLENLLALVPGDEAVREALADLRAQQERAAEPAPPEAAPPGEAALVEPEAPSEASLDLQDYLCPYCMAQTRERDPVCPSCGRPLWVRSDAWGHSFSRMTTILVLQSACVILLVIGLLSLLAYAGAGFHKPLSLAQAYLGIGDAVPADIAAAAFAVLPRWIFFALLGMVAHSLLVLAGLYLRWPPALYMFVLNAVGLLGSGVLIATLLWDVGLSFAYEANALVRVILVVANLSMAAAILTLLFELRGDFFEQKTRLLFRLDRDTSGGHALLVRGRDYGRRGLWGLSALHLRRAVRFLPDEAEAFFALALAYISLQRYDEAAEVLAEARELAPEAPQLAELQALWQERRGGG